MAQFPPTHYQPFISSEPKKQKKPAESVNNNTKRPDEKISRNTQEFEKKQTRGAARLPLPIPPITYIRLDSEAQSRAKSTRSRQPHAIRSRRTTCIGVISWCAAASTSAGRAKESAHASSRHQYRRPCPLQPVDEIAFRSRGRQRQVRRGRRR